jgi:Mrp family chromosome partitioning ATPase
LGRVRQRFDYVLLRTSSGLVSDTAILATQGDGVLFVVDAQNTRRCASRQSIRNPEALRAKVIDTMMVNVRRLREGYCGGGCTHR